MGPELHLQLILNRVDELREEAARHRRVREAIKSRKNRTGEVRRRSLFGRTPNT
ncbi:hypothetical protein [Sinosporangium siamense]|uniref:Uncharacterized protein n=1 Tax=Sinosporangium siamense TaxID=1367973 RepID=A0A919V5W9_9ACTN|nr:hypothetical protein [Sinosporangium siamense]GII93465.1 hypothetical protein Ssi02_36960 [Sinosporangium siamense]